MNETAVEWESKTKMIAWHGVWCSEIDTHDRARRRISTIAFQHARASCYLLPFPGIDTPPRPHPHPLITSLPLPIQNPRQDVLIHQILLLPPLPPRHTPHILLLILRQDQLIPPPALPTTTLTALPLLTRAARPRLRNTIHIPAIIPLHVRFQMQLELPLLIRRARHARKSRLSASGTELFGHVFGGVEAGVAAEDELLDLGDALAGAGRDEVEVDLEENVLEGEVAGHGGDLQSTSFCFSDIIIRGFILGLVLLHVGGRDPAFV